jgi:hypothetical protein
VTGATGNTVVTVSGCLNGSELPTTTTGGPTVPGGTVTPSGPSVPERRGRDCQSCTRGHRRAGCSSLHGLTPTNRPRRVLRTAAFGERVLARILHFSQVG